MFDFVTAFAAAALIATPAPAGEQRDRAAMVTITVRHADLDLQSIKGRATLNRRLDLAIDKVCGSYAAASGEEAVTIAGCRAEVQRDITRQLAARRNGVQLARR